MIPRLEFVLPDELVVRITMGKYVKSLTPGWFVVWPLIQEIQVITKTVQVVNLQEQGLQTLDGKSLAISGAVEYAVRDSVKAILEVQDVDKSLPVLCLGKIAEFVESRNLADCTSENIKTELRKEVREHVGAWGVGVKHIFITDRIIATAHKVMITTAPITMVGE